MQMISHQAVERLAKEGKVKFEAFVEVIVV